MKQRFDLNGYPVARLSKQGISKSPRIHQIVALAFNGNGYALGLEIDHKDGNKLNNHYSNLEWVTRKENQQRAKNNLLFNPRSKLTPLQMLEIKDSNKTLGELAIEYSVRKSLICRIKSGQRGTYSINKYIQARQ